MANAEVMSMEERLGLVDNYRDGLLAPLIFSSAEDDRRLGPYSTTLAEAYQVLVGGSVVRHQLFVHLTNASTWLRQILVPPVEIWVRGDFAANLLPEPSRLDLVVIWDGGVRSPQALWPLALLAASPISLHPGEMHLTLLRRSDVDFADDYAREAKRSGRRCRDRDGTSVETGWLEFGEEEP